jgi:hypothetical protein
VVEAVAGMADVYMDDDMRCSTDVFQVLTLGARAGLMGGSVFWDLAVEEAGGRMMLERLRDALDATVVTPHHRTSMDRVTDPCRYATVLHRHGRGLRAGYGTFFGPL